MSGGQDALALVVPAQRARWVLLVGMGVGLSALLLWWQLRLDDRVVAARQIAQQQASVAAEAARPRGPELPVLSQAAQDGLRAELALLNRDWNALLVALVPGKDVQLLALDVNPASGVVRVDAHAADRASVTAFVQALEATVPLAQVRLLRVEQQASGLVFEVDAQWQ